MYIYVYIYIYMHTHTDAYIYILMRQPNMRISTKQCMWEQDFYCVCDILRRSPIKGLQRTVLGKMIRIHEFYPQVAFT